MLKRKPPSKRQQAKLMQHAEERKTDYLRTWQQNPRFRAALHSQDEKAVFDMRDPAQLAKCWALSNLQPLWEAENQSKGHRERRAA